MKVLKESSLVSVPFVGSLCAMFSLATDRRCPSVNSGNDPERTFSLT